MGTVFLKVETHGPRRGLAHDHHVVVVIVDHVHAPLGLTGGRGRGGGVVVLAEAAAAEAQGLAAPPVAQVPADALLLVAARGRVRPLAAVRRARLAAR